MRPLTGLFQAENYPDLLIGLDAPDDAAVYRLNAEQAVINTVDFFPPVVDDPYAFGAIAAANALSDIYAMGGEPLLAINLVAFPDGLGMELLTEILRGGAEKVREAGAVIAGGHTVTDKEPKYGLAVTGIIHPERIISKSGAQPGDKLILTKPLGSGVITTALKNGKTESSHVAEAVRVMSRLNRDAARIAQQFGVHAMTDITGYALLGHAHEMAHLSHVGFDLEYAALPWMPGTLIYAEQDLFAGGMYRNMEYFAQWVKFGERFSAIERQLLYDPQTSGGLLIAVPPEKVDQMCEALVAAGDKANIIGSVTAGDGRIRVQ